ncbi:Fur family transcriptional regulator [Enterococcus cecorum]|uniref:Fur family transcriptional regulator n=1 Tax=Enterococcus cecorum TaxID=44008 RepID=UPI00148DE4BA|nr:Fur family transcriptional regulator [Enterococcus cecorum]MCJ0574115.1 transcriptional repressor [Enterococcus cecorum]MDZ5439701.1 Fur family transcriptional regulator [Enterococcus cecorum]MDZ5497763.1 Fur family transcriptional regulator [Enterococcus cecorum]MDZ5499546.1 Fur family transcriptional regulator [Enterococcus cecorum]MDZ5562183.1 Fur family transcriptional regulator [Enterococcus cecorum]
MSTTLEHAISKLESENIRLTSQRMAILEYLENHHIHPTAEEIYHGIKESFPGISVATVYNNLRLFTDLGFLKEMSYGDSSSRFDFTIKPHYHVICEKCGKITDFFYPGLDDVEMAAGKITNHLIHSHRLEVYGICEECQKKGEK